MRVYVPSNLSALREMVAAGGLGPAPVLAFAVTPALREWYTDGDIEELEYAAMMDAARASLRMLEADPGAPPRRVVLAVDVPDGEVAPAPEFERAAVQVAAVIPLRKVAAVHMDAAGAEGAVRDAVAAIAKADLGDDDARFIVDGVEDHELQWYATQEIPHLLND
jgi:hypothetical protein